MKAKQLFLALAVLLVAAGWWFARSAWRTSTFHNSRMDAGSKTPSGQLQAGQNSNPPAHLRPPDPTRRFTDFTPEQRVQFARKGSGPGG